MSVKLAWLAVITELGSLRAFVPMQSGVCAELGLEPLEYAL